jgi:hypothetical protein
VHPISYLPATYQAPQRLQIGQQWIEADKARDDSVKRGGVGVEGMGDMGDHRDYKHHEQLPAIPHKGFLHNSGWSSNQTLPMHAE